MDFPGQYFLSVDPGVQQVRLDIVFVRAEDECRRDAQGGSDADSCILVRQGFGHAFSAWPLGAWQVVRGVAVRISG